MSGIGTEAKQVTRHQRAVSSLRKVKLGEIAICSIETSAGRFMYISDHARAYLKWNKVPPPQKARD